VTFVSYREVWSALT